MIIAIDGPAAAGKGTIALRLAEHYRLNHLDTGLLYRAIGRKMADNGLDLDDPEAAGAVARALDPADLGHADLRGREAGELASRVAVHPPVRAALVDFQREFRPPSAGRRSGRARHRHGHLPRCGRQDIRYRLARSPGPPRSDELIAKGRDAAYERILAEIRERDERDSGRAAAPLQRAPDAALLDTSDLGIEAAFQAALAIIEAKRS